MSCFTLDDNLLAQVAELRAHGYNWLSAASAIGWDVDVLRSAIRNAPDYQKFYNDAKRDVRDEVEAEMIAALRSALHDPDSHHATHAAECLEKYLSGERRDRTRLEVEKFRAETARVKATLPEEPAPAWPSRPEPEDPNERAANREIPRPEYQQELVDEIIRKRATLFLWSGKHPVGSVEPTSADIPLRMVRGYVGNDRYVYWATCVPFRPGAQRNQVPRTDR